MPPKKGSSKAKAKSKGKGSKRPNDSTQEQEQITIQEVEETKNATQAAVEENGKAVLQSSREGMDEAMSDLVDSEKENTEVAKNDANVANESVEASQEASTKDLALDQRQEKLNQLRLRMRQSAKDNRADVITETQKAKITAREIARLEKQRKLHELLRLKADAEDRGEDVERRKNWEYTIEENDEWEKRLKRKRTRADFEFHDDTQAAQRKYKKDLDYIKLDLTAYNEQKEAALGYEPGTLVAASSSTDVVLNQAGPVTTQQRLAAENLYRDANSLLYADNKPSEEAIDRVVSKLNIDLDNRGKRSRKRAKDDDGDITYINERNRMFNKKIARYYDKYTAEIRASFERGTAL